MNQYHKAVGISMLITVLLCFGVSALKAQTISQRQSQGTTALYNGGQSFTATLTGQVTEIHILVAKEATARQLRLYANQKIATNNVLKKADYSELINLKKGWNIIHLSTPFRVNEGEQYLFIVSGTIVYKGHFGNIYKQGHSINNNRNAASRTDIAFEVVQEIEE